MNRKSHNLLNRLVLGEDHDQVNAVMDRPSKYLGPGHRVLFHDRETALLFAIRSPKKGLACLLHLSLDNDPDLQNMVEKLEAVKSRPKTTLEKIRLMKKLGLLD